MISRLDGHTARRDILVHGVRIVQYTKSHDPALSQVDSNYTFA